MLLVTPKAPTFLLLKNNSFVESGFIIGKSSSGTIVEVSLDDGTFSEATGSEIWRFQLPTGSQTWRLNSTHTISIRARSGSGTSRTERIKVRKGKNRDVNGDGFPDIILGTPSFSSNLGQIQIFHGSISGILSQSSSQANTTFTGSAFGRLGLATVSGDINGDGFADVLAASPRFSVLGGDDGKVYILYGKEGGITASSDLEADVTISASVNNGWLGRALAVGDLNSDGYDDAILGAFLQAGGSGRIFIINGKASSIANGTETALTNSIITGTSASRIGESLETADFNGDGITDLTSGGTSANNGNAAQGRVYIFHGSTSGIPTINETSANTTIIGTNIANSRLGCSVGYGDINGDGIHDLLTGACAGNTNGISYIFHGSQTGIPGGNDTSANSTIVSTKASGLFGSYLRVADFNDDSFQDLIVGSSGVGSFRGEVYIFNGTTNGIQAVNELVADTIIGGTIINGNLGIAVSAYDYDSDSNTDLLISTTGEGRLYFYRNLSKSIPSGSNTTSNQSILGVSSFAESIVY